MLRLNWGVKSVHWNIIRWQSLEICQYFPRYDAGKERAKSVKLKPQGWVSSLNLYTANPRAVIDVENLMIFGRPVTESGFLSQKVWVVSTAAASSDSGSWTHMSFFATFPRAFSTSLAARSPLHCVAVSVPGKQILPTGWRIALLSCPEPWAQGEEGVWRPPEHCSSLVVVHRV